MFYKYKYIIPEEYVKSIFDIDYNKLYAMGKRIILSDLDNTLISYKEKLPTKALYDWLKMVEEIGFKVILVSNNISKKRVRGFAKLLNIPFTYFSLKPLKLGFKRALKKGNRKYNKDEVVELGDQLLTDVYGSKRMGFYTILVDAIDHKTETFFTRMNRKNERKIIKHLKKKDFNSYLKLKDYEEKNL